MSLVLRVLVEKFRDGQNGSSCVFVDLEKAYDRVTGGETAVRYETIRTGEAYAIQPFENLAHGENEFDTTGLGCSPSSYNDSKI